MMNIPASIVLTFHPTNLIRKDSKDKRNHR
jgi:hypothetical protein